MSTLNEDHYRAMIDRNPNATFGLTIVLHALDTIEPIDIHDLRALDYHELHDKYGTALTADEFTHEIDRAKGTQ